MAIWAQTDFEAGTNGNTVSGSPFQDTSLIVYDNSDPIHGTMSAHAGPKGAGEDWDLQIDVSAKATWRARVYVRLEASVPGPTPAGDYFLMVKEGSQYICGLIRRKVGEDNVRIVDYDNANYTVPAQTTADWTVGTVWRFEIIWDGLQFSVEFYYGSNVEGTTPDESYTYTPSTNSPDTLFFGAGLSSASVGEYTIDEIAVSDGEQIEPVATPPFTPANIAYVWSGAQTPNGFSAVVRSNAPAGTELALRAATNMSLSSGVVTSSYYTVDGDGYVNISVNGLDSDTNYYYSVVQQGQAIGDVHYAKTLPVNGSAKDFKITFGHCYQNQMVLSPTAAYDDIIAEAPLFFIHLGDFYYWDEISEVASVHRSIMESRIESLPQLQTLLADVATYYIRSDHDGGGGDNDDPGNYYIANQTAYKQVVPSQPLINQPTNALYTAWTVGRTRFIQLDTRNMYRSPHATPEGPDKTMLGSAQKAWLKTELERTESLKVILSDPPWMGETLNTSTQDKWPNYSTERAEIGTFIEQTCPGQVLMIVGDYHASFVTNGTNNPYGGFPVVAAGPLHQSGSAQSATYDWREDAGGSDVQRYGTMEFVDNATDTITATYKSINAEDDSTMYTKVYTFNAPRTNSINQFGGSGQKLNNPSLSEWASAVAYVLGSDKTVDERIQEAIDAAINP